MRIGHWDARFGISGDMALGSALSAGARPQAVAEALARLGVPGLRVETAAVRRGGLACVKADVHWDGSGRDIVAARETGGSNDAAEHVHPHPPVDVAHPHGGAEIGAHKPAAGGSPAAARRAAHAHDPADPAAGSSAGARVHSSAGSGGSGAHRHGRTHADIRELLRTADLPDPVRSRALEVFAALASAEGAVHGSPADAVHFHEVGAEDAIADVVGTCAALEDLGLSSMTCSPLPAGGGTVTAAHGLLPVPAPAVALLLRGFVLEPGPTAAELVTPTGAALVAALCRPSPTWPSMRLLGVGWGAGTADFPGHPNACRLVWGESPEGALTDGGPRRERLVEIETHIDDQAAEALAYVCERLFALGALDVACSPLLMKKQRSGVRLWALVPLALAEQAAASLFRESTALGVRLREVDRWSLPRDAAVVNTPWGDVSVKRGWLGGEIVNVAPEFEDCRRAAQRHGVPFKLVHQAAMAAAQGAPAAPAGRGPGPAGN